MLCASAGGANTTKAIMAANIMLWERGGRNMACGERGTGMTSKMTSPALTATDSATLKG